MYYFAFGSNLLHSQMAERCPESKFVGPAALQDYKLVFDGYHERWKGGLANVVPADGEQVLGGVYDITDNDLQSLDRFEEYPGTYNRTTMVVQMLGGTTCDAIVYVRPPQEERLPSKKYLTVINAGRRDCGIEEVVEVK